MDGGSRAPARLRPERLGRAEVRETLAAARELAARGPFTLELAGLQALDSTAIAVMLALRRAHGAAVRFADPPANLRKLASLYGVDALLFDEPPAQRAPG